MGQIHMQITTYYGHVTFKLVCKPLDWLYTRLVSNSTNCLDIAWKKGQRLASYENSLTDRFQFSFIVSFIRAFCFLQYFVFLKR